MSEPLIILKEVLYSPFIINTLKLAEKCINSNPIYGPGGPNPKNIKINTKWTTLYIAVLSVRIL